jgi:sigma-E factor negative regulatory protein RseA
MSNNSNEKLSAFMDDESHPDVIELIKHDSEARGRWARYHLIRDVLSGHTEALPSSNFAERVSKALRDEPTILMPARRGLNHTIKQIGGLAIAATVATIAVLTVQQGDVTTGTTSHTPIASVDTVPQELRTVSINPLNRPINSEVENKLSSYLVNHNEYSISSRLQGMLPYTRLVSVTPAKRVVDGADDK